ncbi:MAG: beta-lactamase family protein [Actinomycetia bacterium]|nr:beta-lactamase family protein [Actinomycetes bacterium]
MEIHGHCDERFTAVHDALADGITIDQELDQHSGASASVTVDGEVVVDLWGGWAGPAQEWERDTIVNVYSTTKTMAATCVLLLADRGALDLQAPVATYWPEFAAAGKEGVTVAHVMGHAAGLSGFELPTTIPDLYDWDRIVERLAAQAPWWEPGSAPGYHAVTQGYLQGEIVRRVDGRDIDTFFRQEIAEPLGADFQMGVGPADDERIGELIPPSELTASRADLPDGISTRSLTNPTLTALEPQTRQWRAATIPAAGGFGNARSVARVHSMLACGGTVDGVEVMSPAGVEAALTDVVEGTDLVLGTHTRFGMGFGLPSVGLPLPNPRSFSWGGWGGSVAVIDLDARMSIAYVMNRMEGNLLGDTRGASVLMAAYGSLANS